LEVKKKQKLSLLFEPMIQMFLLTCGLGWTFGVGVLCCFGVPFGVASISGLLAICFLAGGNLPIVSDVELIRCFMMSIHPGLGRLGLLLVFLVLFWVQCSVAISNGLDLGFSQNLVASSVLHMHPQELFLI
jgi:hypothetical protein